MTKHWTPQEIEDVCLKQSTMTAKQIGAEYGVTDRSIVGVWRRARIAGVPAALPVRDLSTLAKENNRSGNADMGRVRELSDRSVIFTCEGVGIMELEQHHCRFVIGHGEDGMSRFCGSHTGFAGSWCPNHRPVVFAADQKSAARALSVWG